MRGTYAAKRDGWSGSLATYRQITEGSNGFAWKYRQRIIEEQQSQHPKQQENAYLITRYLIPIAIIILAVSLLVFAGVRLVSLTVGGTAIQDKPISDVLNMADRHQLKLITIDGSDVYATSKTGLQYHSIKEDGFALTDEFRKDGVSVSIDNSQHGQWLQGAVDILLIALVAGMMYFAIKRGNMGGQAAPFARSKAKRFSETSSFHPF